MLALRQCLAVFTFAHADTMNFPRTSYTVRVFYFHYSHPFFRGICTSEVPLTARLALLPYKAGVPVGHEASYTLRARMQGSVAGWETLIHHFAAFYVQLGKELDNLVIFGDHRVPKLPGTCIPP